MGEDEDTIGLQMRNVVQQVENITRAAVKANSGVTAILIMEILLGSGSGY
jgi:hypothetical protein